MLFRSLPGSEVKLIRLNPEWSVENAASTPIEQELSIDDFKGKRLIITLPGAGGFCNKEFDLVKDNMDKFKAAGAEEVIVVVGTDILSNAGRGLPNLFQDVSQEFGKDRKSTRLNSSHVVISYAVFCLKKKKNEKRSLK